MNRLLISLFVFCLFGACNNPSPGTEKNTPEVSKTTPPPQASVGEAKYPAKPVAQLIELNKQCTFVDYSFYELPISMSFDNAASIQQILQLLEIQPPLITGNCKPTGRAFFQRDGEDIAAAEFYLTENCYYFVFMEDNKPVYANKLSEEGIKWYQNSLSRAFQQVPSK